MKKTPRTHLDRGPAVEITSAIARRYLCRPADFLPPDRVTADESAVTCGSCLRMLAEGRAPTIPAAPFAPSGPYTPARGASELDARGARVVIESITGESPEQFNDLGHALWAWSHPLPWHDGLRSNGHDADQRGGPGERIPNAPLHRIAPVAKAIAAACAAGYQRDGGERRVGSVRLSPDDCARIVRGILGGPREPAISAEQIADDLNADPARRAIGEHAVTAQQVGRVWAHLRREIGALLWARGLLARQPREKVSGPLARARDLAYSDGRGQALSEAPVHLPGHDLEGSKAIEQHLGCSSSAVQRYAGRAASENPLPVTRYAGKLWASKAALDAWRARECRSSAA